MESEELHLKGSAALLMVSIVGTRDEYLSIKDRILAPVMAGTAFDWISGAEEIIKREKEKWEYDVVHAK